MAGDRTVQDHESFASDGHLTCEGCGAETPLPHEPTEDLMDAIEAFVHAHSGCGGRLIGYGSDLRSERDRTR